MHRKVLFVFGMLVCILAIGNSTLFADEVEFAVDEANPPFMYKDSASGEAAGLYPEMVKAIFKEIGTDAKVLAFPWKRTLQLGESGKMGIAGIYKNEKRLLIYDYSDPIFDEKIVFYTKKDKRFNYSGIADLKGKQIGVIRGWSYGDDFDNSKEKGVFTVQETNSDEQNFKKLAADRLDCLLAIEQSGDSIIEKMGLKDKIVMLDNAMVVNSTFVVFAKIANQQGLIKKINATLSRIKKDGSYQKLVEKVFREEGQK